MNICYEISSMQVCAFLSKDIQQSRPTPSTGFGGGLQEAFLQLYQKLNKNETEAVQLNYAEEVWLLDSMLAQGNYIHSRFILIKFILPDVYVLPPEPNPFSGFKEGMIYGAYYQTGGIAIIPGKTGEYNISPVMLEDDLSTGLKTGKTCSYLQHLTSWQIARGLEVDIDQAS